MAGDLAAPEPVDPPFAAPERSTLESWLEIHRATLLLTCDGLSDEQRKRRPAATSLMSLRGMVRPWPAWSATGSSAPLTGLTCRRSSGARTPRSRLRAA